MMNDLDRAIGRLLLQRGLVEQPALHHAGRVTLARREAGQKTEVLAILIEMGLLQHNAARAIWVEAYAQLNQSARGSALGPTLPPSDAAPTPLDVQAQPTASPTAAVGWGSYPPQSRLPAAPVYSPIPPTIEQMQAPPPIEAPQPPPGLDLAPPGDKAFFQEFARPPAPAAPGPQPPPPAARPRASSRRSKRPVSVSARHRRPPQASVRVTKTQTTLVVAATVGGLVLLSTLTLLMSRDRASPAEEGSTASPRPEPTAAEIATDPAPLSPGGDSEEARPIRQTESPALSKLPSPDDPDGVEEASWAWSDEIVSNATDLALADSPDYRAALAELARFPPQLRGGGGYAKVEEKKRNYARYLAHERDLRELLGQGPGSSALKEKIVEVELGQLAEDVLELPCTERFMKDARTLLGPERYDQIVLSASTSPEEEAD